MADSFYGISPEAYRLWSEPYKGPTKPLTLDLLRQMADLIREASVHECHLCHSKRNLRSLVLLGVGIAWTCQKCIDAGRVVVIEEKPSPAKVSTRSGQGK